MNISYQIIRHQWDLVKNSEPFPEKPDLLKRTLCAWKCEKGHFWYETIEDRAYYQKCHMCQTSRSVTNVYNLHYLRPDLAAQLHPTKNKNAIADKLTPRSSKTMTWICDKAHEWEAKICSRSEGQGCPECSNRKIGKANNLVVLYPNVAAEWDYEENGNLTPDQVVPGSCKKVGWKCKKGHKWSTRVVNRTTKKQGCPECTNRKVGKDNNLAILRPDLAAQWDNQENGELTPDQVVPGSPKKVGWKCIKGHQWKATIASRMKGRNCPKCCRRGGDYSKIIDESESVAVLRPYLLLEWDNEENENISLYKLSLQSSKKIYWKCSKGHKWKAAVKDRLKGKGCTQCYHLKIKENKDNTKSDLKHKYRSIKSQWDSIANNEPFPHFPSKQKHLVGKWRCKKGHFWYETIEKRAHYQKCHMCQTKRRVTEVHNLQYLRPDLTAQLHPVKNKGMIADKVLPNSGERAWWICDKGHEWEARICARNAGQGCPGCCNRKVSDDNSLAVLCPDLAAEWDYEENGDLTPDQVVPGSNKRVAWICSKGHKWNNNIANRTKLGSGCPKCPHNKVIKINKDRSFAIKHPELVREFHPTLNGNISLYELSSKSNIRIWWKCEKGHVWDTLLATRSYGSRCPECMNRKVGKDNNLAVLRPDLVLEWDDEENGDLKPNQVVLGSGKKVTWKCNKGHRWKAAIQARVNGSGCVHCYRGRGKFKKLHINS